MALHILPLHPARLASLPTELLVRIILELDWPTVLRLQLVNSRFYTISKSHASVSYHLALRISGLTNGPAFPLIPLRTAERLARLRLCQERWKRLAPTRVVSVRKGKGSLWEFARGVLGQSVKDRVDEDGMMNEVNGGEEDRELFFTRLPGGTRGGWGVKEWKAGPFEFVIRDFTMDPGQDLLVLLKSTGGGGGGGGGELGGIAEIHLRSLLRASERHPGAKSEVLRHALCGGTRGKAHSLQVYRERFAVFHSSLAGQWPDKLVLYDWRTGELVFEISFCGIMSFAFLSSRHLLFAVQPFNVMPACHGDHQPRLIICDIDQTAALRRKGDTECYAAIAELHLPELKQYADVVDILIRADAAPPPPDSGSGSDSSDVWEKENVIPPAPFSTAADNRLFVITLRVETVLDDMGDHRASERLTLGLFVPLSTLLPFTYSEAYEIIHTNSIDTPLFFGDFHTRAPRRVSVPWTAWLAHGGRALLVPGMECRVWVCNVFGGRVVCAVGPREEEGGSVMRRVAVLDFGRDRVRREREKEGEGCDVLEGEYCEEDEEGYYDEAQGGGNEDVDISGGGYVRASHPPLASQQTQIDTEYYTEPSTLHAARCGIFEEDVVTGWGVPYRRTVMREKVRFEGVMMYEDGVLFVNNKALREFEVRAF